MLKTISKVKGLLVVALLAAVCFQSNMASAQLAVGGDFGIGPGDNDGGYSDNSISYDQAYRVTLALYQAVLFRQGEPDGVDYWVSAILNGRGTDGLLGAAQGFAESEEYRRNVLSRYRANEIVNHIYQVFFHRNADQSGLRTWGNLIRQGRSGEALRGIVGSEEFRRHFLIY